MQAQDTRSPIIVPNTDLSCIYFAISAGPLIRDTVTRLGNVLSAATISWLASGVKGLIRFKFDESDNVKFLFWGGGGEEGLVVSKEDIRN